MKTLREFLEEANMGPHTHPAFANPEGELFKDGNGILYYVTGKRSNRKAVAFDPRWAMVMSYDKFKPMKGKMVPWTKMVKKATIKKMVNAISYELDIGDKFNTPSDRMAVETSLDGLNRMGR